jgi:hypothetical protein
MTDSNIQDRAQALFDKLVPRSGPSETLEGEFIRAITRLQYRWHNDGDWYDKGYGIETSGPAESFLYTSVPGDLRSLVTRILDDTTEDEEKTITSLQRIVVPYVEDKMKADKLTPFSGDMHDFEPRFVDEEDYDDEEYDGEEEEYY